MRISRHIFSAETILKSVDSWSWPLACVIGRILSAGASTVRRVFGIAPKERPLMVRPGGMGDLVCLQIAMESLGINPRDFDWILEIRSAPWAEMQKLSALYYNESPSLPLLKRMAGSLGAYRVVYNSEQYFGLSQALANACLASTQKRSIGFETNRASRFNERRIPYDPWLTHEVLAFAQFLDDPGPARVEKARPPTRPRSSPPQDYQCVGIGGLQVPSRRLDLASWKVLILKNLDLSKPILFLCAPVDRQPTLELARLLTREYSHSSFSVFEGPFESLCQTLSKAARLLTIDSGMVHLASYYGIPTLAIFTSGRDQKWAPLAEGSLLFKRNDLPCQPCTLFGQVPPCKFNFACKDLDRMTPSPAAAPNSNPEVLR